MIEHSSYLLGKIWTSTAESLLWSGLLKKVHFYLAIGKNTSTWACVKRRSWLPALDLVDSAPQTAPFLQGPGKTGITYMVSAIF